MASVFSESGIEFDFSRAHSALEYEKIGVTPPQKNTFWAGIDFCIEDISNEVIWLEVKSWNPARIDAVRRGGSQRSFVAKMRSESFGLEMRSKFRGTSAFFGWRGDSLPTKVRYIAILEPPRLIDAALMGTLTDRLKNLKPPKSLSWRSRIDVSVLNLSEWNQRFPEYPAHFELKRRPS